MNVWQCERNTQSSFLFPNNKKHAAFSERLEERKTRHISDTFRALCRLLTGSPRTSKGGELNIKMTYKPIPTSFHGLIVLYFFLPIVPILSYVSASFRICCMIACLSSRKSASRIIACSISNTSTIRRPTESISLSLCAASPCSWYAIFAAMYSS